MKRASRSTLPPKPPAVKSIALQSSFNGRRPDRVFGRGPPKGADAGISTDARRHPGRGAATGRSSGATASSARARDALEMLGKLVGDLQRQKPEGAGGGGGRKPPLLCATLRPAKRGIGPRAARITKGGGGGGGARPQQKAKSGKRSSKKHHAQQHRETGHQEHHQSCAIGPHLPHQNVIQGIAGAPRSPARSTPQVSPMDSAARFDTERPSTKQREAVQC